MTSTTVTQHFKAEMTRDEILDAIETETNLRHGSWCTVWATSSHAEEAVDRGECYVCAAGAALWRAGLSYREICGIAYHLAPQSAKPLKNATEFLVCVRANPLETLSRVFENASRGRNYYGRRADIKDPRAVALEVVREYFPAKIQLRWSVQWGCFFNVRYELEGAS